jgi:hypothetical protein
MKAELPWKASGDFLAYISGNIIIMCCIDSLACRFASFVRTDEEGDVGDCGARGRHRGRRQRVRRRQRRLGRDRALLHGARLLDFKNWTQSQSCEVRRRLLRTAPRPPCMRRRRLHYVGAAPPRAEYSRTVGWVRLVSQSRQYRRVRF